MESVSKPPLQGTCLPPPLFSFGSKVRLGVLGVWAAVVADVCGDCFPSDLKLPKGASSPALGQSITDCKLSLMGQEHWHIDLKPRFSSVFPNTSLRPRGPDFTGRNPAQLLLSTHWPGRKGAFPSLPPGTARTLPPHPSLQSPGHSAPWWRRAATAWESAASPYPLPKTQGSQVKSGR